MKWQDIPRHDMTWHYIINVFANGGFHHTSMTNMIDDTCSRLCKNSVREGLYSAMVNILVAKQAIVWQKYRQVVICDNNMKN